MRAGKVAGVQLIFNNWFLAMVVFFLLTGLGPKVFGVIVSLLCHELAHAFAAMSLGLKVREIELMPFGGVARIEGIGEAGAINEIIVAAAGPLTSVILAATLHFIMENNPVDSYVLDFYFKTNLMLAVFNLLPGLPLDGGRIVRAFLALRRDYASATRIAGNLGKLISLLLLVVAAVDFWRSGTVNLTFFSAAVFLYVAAKAEMAVAGFRTMRLLTRKKAEFTRCGVMPTAYFTALTTTRVRDIIRLFTPEQYFIVVVVDTEFRMQGMITESQVWDSLPARGIYAKIGDFL